VEKSLRVSSPRNISFLCFIAFFLFIVPAFGAALTLEWDASAMPNLDHYVVYWGTSSANYPMSEVVPSDTTTYRVTGLAADTRYYFAVTAVDAQNNESLVSREVSWTKHTIEDEEGRNAEWGITSGTLRNFDVVFDDAADIPSLGDSGELPEVNLPGVTSVGTPLNLQLSGIHFNPPVKLFIPCPGYRDVGSLNVYYYDDVTMEWYLANDADDPDRVQPDAVGWMVPGSRVNHNNGDPSTIEIQVYHFSGAQAGSTSVSGSGAVDSTSSGGCFIATVSSQPFDKLRASSR
jgi:chitodextrinase